MPIRPFRVDDTDPVIELWRLGDLVRSWNAPRRDIARKLTVQPELFLVVDDPDAGVVATAMSGYDGHRGWIHYLAVHPQHRGRGLGSHTDDAVAMGRAPSRSGSRPRAALARGRGPG